MKYLRLTTVEALVNYLLAQKIDIDGEIKPLFGCAFAIFGHGNVTCLGEQLRVVQDELPTWRGQNEQSMAMAAVAYAKANRRRRAGIVTTSIGPGAANVITAAGVAHTNRLPLLILSGDAYASRLPDPVLQQTEHFGNPNITINDAFQAATRYWDRITRPSQLLHSLPHAIDTLIDPVDCGPVFLGLPQDVQGEVYDFPEAFFADRILRIRCPEPEALLLNEAEALIRGAKRPLIIAGGGVRYANAEQTLEEFAERHRIPVVETIAGRASLLQSHALNAGPIGVTGADSANKMAAASDLVIAVGTRLQDFTTGSWTVFQDPDVKFIAVNVCRWDATKHHALPVIADAKAALQGLTGRLGTYTADKSWAVKAARLAQEWKEVVTQRVTYVPHRTPSYAQIVGEVNGLIETGDTVLTAAGGLPAELTMNWQSQQIGKFDIEFGFSCMGYEIAGGWGAKLANPDHDVIVLVGDGSYLMMNSDVYSSVLTGQKLIIIVCDNGGFAVIDKLQTNTGNASFNNLFSDCRRVADEVPRVDFVKHAEALGAIAEKVDDFRDFSAAFSRAKRAYRTYVLVVDVDPDQWSSCDCWWEVGLPADTRSDVSAEKVAAWRQGHDLQRRGV